MNEQEIYKIGFEALQHNRERKIAAIKELREKTLIDLVDAKRIIEEIDENYDYYNNYFCNQDINDAYLDDDTDYENMDVEELKKQIEKEKLIAELKALKQQNNEDFPIQQQEKSSSVKSTQKMEKPLSKKQLIKQNKKNGIACCPKCGSTSIQAGNKKLSVGRAVVGTMIMPGVGTVLGGLSSKKTICTCLVCGHKWKVK